MSGVPTGDNRERAAIDGPFGSVRRDSLPTTYDTWVSNGKREQ